MSAKSEIQIDAIETTRFIIDEISRFKNVITKIDLDDPKCATQLYYSLKNLSDTLKIYKRDIDYELKYNDQFKNI